ncbi:MAG: hypothetical protein E4G93_04765 [Dehalococcoidia bacterium]|nr:MAG: hypothetical protein E4G93_04765 [Dehalococcoidia bacterium]
MEDEKNNQDNVQIVKVEQISLSTMDLQQQRMAERLYSQLGLDPVVNKVLKEYKSNLRGMDRATDTVFGPFDIKGRAESAAKVAALMTYSALHQQYTTDLGQMQEQMSDVESQRDRERANYDSLVQKVADVVGGDYDELRANYEGVVDKLSDVEHLKLQTVVLNQEKADLVQRYESQLTGLQKEKADVIHRYEVQITDVQKDKAETVSRYEEELAALREEFRKAAEDLRAQIADRGERISVLEREKATVIGERESLASQLGELQKSHADLESRNVALGVSHAKLRAAAAGIEGSVDYAEIRKRMGPEMHDFVLKDSKVPDAVIDGVGKFIDIKKYLGQAVESGAREGTKKAAEVLKAS